MGRYTGPRERISRALGTDLLLKGKRAEAGKTAMQKGRPRPGQHGRARHKVSEYGLRLREKQKLRHMYGLREKQFRKYYEMAARSTGVTGERLLQLLETRLDNVVYRLGFATTRAQARQFVSHRHLLVNGKRVNIPSYRVKSGDIITVLEKSRDFVKNNLEDFNGIPTPNWLSVDINNLTGQVLTIPVKEEIDTAQFIKDNLVVEFYSK